jgi:hypothetical protein
MTDHEKWREALAAFYRAQAMFQSAENVARGAPLTPANKRDIDELARQAA